MREFLKPDFKVNSFDVKKDYGRFVLENLERGFGITLGNALRRVLLSSIPGTAVYRVTIQGARHEFSALEGVVEDVTTIILNLKGLVIKMDNEDDNAAEDLKLEVVGTLLQTFIAPAVYTSSIQIWLSPMSLLKAHYQ